MKPLPRYWARHHETVTFRGGTTWDMTISGASFTSEEDALRDARQRLARFVASGGPDGDTPRDWYYPDRHLPEELLEEIHGEGGELIGAITRNRYGAAILNTDAVLITDVDIRVPSAREARRAARGATGGGRDATGGGPQDGASRAGGLLGRLFGRGSTSPQGHPTGSTGPGAEPGAGTPSPSGFEARAQQEIARITGLISDFALLNPGLGVRTYRTRNGFRVLITGTDAPPRSERAAAIMSELTSDDLYMTLCRVQESYRARLTPKPWRIDVRRIHGEGPWWAGTDLQHDWVREYTAASEPYAVCQLVSETGPVPSAEEQRLIELHDRATRPTSGLPLA